MMAAQASTKAQKIDQVDASADEKTALFSSSDRGTV